MDQQQSADTRLTVAEAMADGLAEYLRGDTLYQPMTVQIPGGLEQPVLTVGALLANLKELGWEEGALTDEQRARLAALREGVARTRNALADQWRQKLQRELKALLGSWKWYLDDAEQNESARARYPSEIHIRTRIDLVLRELGSDPAIEDDRKRLAELDARLKKLLRGNKYAGPRGAQAHYSPEQAWWLYGQPVEPDDA